MVLFFLCILKWIRLWVLNFVCTFSGNFIFCVLMFVYKTLGHFNFFVLYLFAEGLTNDILCKFRLSDFGCFVFRLEYPFFKVLASQGQIQVIHDMLNLRISNLELLNGVCELFSYENYYGCIYIYFIQFRFRVCLDHHLPCSDHNLASSFSDKVLTFSFNKTAKIPNLFNNLLILCVFLFRLIFL